MKMEQLERWIAPLKRRVMQSIARAVITAMNDATDLQKVQVQILADEVHSNLDRVQNYGFTSVPKVGAEAVFLGVGGSRENGLIIAIDDRRYRLKALADGEVAIYSWEGSKVHLKNGNKIEIFAAAEVKVDSAKIILEASGDVEVNCANAKVNASAKAEVTAPEVDITAATKVSALTPILEVSGYVVCAGFATAGQTPVAGSAVLGGNLKALGNIEDNNGTMNEMRGYYNSHVHSNPEGGNVGPAVPQMT